MLYFIGLGLNFDCLSREEIEIIKRCKKVYLENYTVEFPYSAKKIEEIIGKKILQADREFVESLKIVDEAKKEDVSLLIYGSPLTATTHISIIKEAINKKVKYKVIYNASILDAVGETGLQIYKFGKIASIPKWTESYKPESFADIIKQNLSIDAHSLILIDIGLEFHDALNELLGSTEKSKIKLNKIVVCSCLGTEKSKIFYDKVENLSNKDIKPPFCIIIPSKLHFMEEEILEKYK